MLLKVCGLRDSDNIEAVCSLPVDLLGFIFYEKSPRFVGETFVIPVGDRKKVGVFVNESLEMILRKVEHYGLDFVQLHGQESSEECRLLKDYVKVIKAFSVDDDFDFSITEPYSEYCDYFLFDAKGKNYGGNGHVFDWKVLRNYTGGTPFLLSGGLGVDQISDIRTFHHKQLSGFDLNSRFEIAPAIKDIRLLETFINAIKSQ